MKFSYSASVEGNVPEAWRFVSDIPAVLQCLPGCRSVGEQDGGRYRFDLVQRVGPFQVHFQVETEVQLDQEKKHIVARGQGQDRRTGNSAQFTIRLEVVPAAQGTQLNIDADLNVRGPVAQLGFAIMQHKAKEVFREFTGRVAEALGRGTGGQHAPVSTS